MSEEVADDDQPVEDDTIESVVSKLHVGFAAFVNIDIVEEASRDLAINAKMIVKLMSYLTGAYYTDSQRNQAKVALFRYIQERDALEEIICNAVAVASTLHEPVTINT